jgi:hypothetical protein
MKKKNVKMRLAKRTVVLPEQHDPVITKKLAAQAKKLAKQRKVVALADAAAKVKRFGTKTFTMDLKPLNDAQTLVAKCPSNQDAPRVEARLLVGGVPYPVDASSLERTLGSGRWGGGRGLVDAWPDAAWVGLLVHLGLPADPLDRTAADQPVKRLVQRLWYEAVDPSVLERLRPVLAERDEERAEEYAAKFDGVKEKAVERSARAKTSFGRTGGETRYQPTAAYKKSAPGGQAGIVQAAFKAAGWAAMTTTEATAATVAAGLKTSTKPERIVAFYLCKGTKNGLFERVTN